MLIPVNFRERMGITEFAAVEKMYNGVQEMIKLEKELEEKEAAGKSQEELTEEQVADEEPKDEL